MKNSTQRKLITILVFLIASVITLSSCNIFNKFTDDSLKSEHEETEEANEAEASSKNNNNSNNKKPSKDADNYSIEFVSNGDGTCYVSNIINSYECEEQYELVIPEKSPAGDTVIEIRTWFESTIVPRVILKEDFEEILWNIAEKLAPKYGVEPEEIMNENKAVYFEMFRVKGYYVLKDPMSEGISEDGLRVMLSEYPFLEYTGAAYICDPNITFYDLDVLSSRLEEFGDYNEKKLVEDYNNLTETVKKNIKDSQLEKEILSQLPTVNFGNNISAVKIPDSVEKIHYRFFNALVDVKEIVIPESVDNIIVINEDMFSYCISLEKLTLNNKVERIEDYAFSKLYNLKSIVITTSVTSIERNAFDITDDMGNDRCQLTDIYYTGTAEEWNAIDIMAGNDFIYEFTIHYNYIID